MIDLIEQHRQQLSELCRKYDVLRLDIFGSAVRDDFDPKKSDLDFLVEYNNWGVEGAANRYLGFLIDLEDLFHRKIDLVAYSAIRNPYFKQVVDRTRVMLYAA
jgi:hypothetical protein